MADSRIRPRWTHGMPTPEQVEEHSRRHAADDGGRPTGGSWLTIDHYGDPFPNVPSIIRLRVGRENQYIPSSNGGLPIPVEGRVLLANGFSFWQLLEPCTWAQRSRYTPVDLEGVPVDFDLVDVEWR